MPPYLAGREKEQIEFRELLKQTTILKNTIFSGLRGIGKTVLLETLKPVAIQQGWLWVGTDVSESTCVSENSIAIRMLTDLSVVTSSIVIASDDKVMIGFGGETIKNEQKLNYSTLLSLYERIPGLAADKLKQVLEIVWRYLSKFNHQGLIFAYDEAQNLGDHSEKEQYPLSLLLDVFQSIQRKNIPFMLVLTGLPTLFPRLIEARTYSERMFHSILLNRLDQRESKDAIVKPTQGDDCPVKFTNKSISTIARISGGYPYFIQFICREVYDAFVQKAGMEKELVLRCRNCGYMFSEAFCMAPSTNYFTLLGLAELLRKPVSEN